MGERLRIIDYGSDVTVDADERVSFVQFKEVVDRAVERAEKAEAEVEELRKYETTHEGLMNAHFTLLEKYDQLKAEVERLTNENERLKQKAVCDHKWLNKFDANKDVWRVACRKCWEWKEGE